jgi:hypothetical protein
MALDQEKCLLKKSFQNVRTWNFEGASKVFLSKKIQNFLFSKADLSTP